MRPPALPRSVAVGEGRGKSAPAASTSGTRRRTPSLPCPQRTVSEFSGEPTVLSTLAAVSAFRNAHNRICQHPFVQRYRHTVCPVERSAMHHVEMIVKVATVTSYLSGLSIGCASFRVPTRPWLAPCSTDARSENIPAALLQAAARCAPAHACSIESNDVEMEDAIAHADM